MGRRWDVRLRMNAWLALCWSRGDVNARGARPIIRDGSRLRLSPDRSGRRRLQPLGARSECRVSDAATMSAYGALQPFARRGSGRSGTFCGVQIEAVTSLFVSPRSLERRCFQWSFCAQSKACSVPVRPIRRLAIIVCPCRRRAQQGTTTEVWTQAAG